MDKLFDLTFFTNNEDYEEVQLVEINSEYGTFNNANACSLKNPYF